MERALRNPYYRIPREFNETWLAKVNLGRPPLALRARSMADSKDGWLWRGSA